MGKTMDRLRYLGTDWGKVLVACAELLYNKINIPAQAGRNDGSRIPY